MSQSVHSVRSIPATEWIQLGVRGREQATPLIIAGGIADIGLARRWSPESLAGRFPNHQVKVFTNLPEHGVPYRCGYEVQIIESTLEQFVTQLALGNRCYLSEYPIHNFDGLAAELDLSALVTPPVGDLHLWLGNGTRSGLHYDRADNLVVQLHGEKRFILVDHRYSGRLRPYSDTPSKSRLDLEACWSLSANPLRGVTYFRGALQPGEILYIPRGYWHYLASDGPSTSVNVWNGPDLDLRDKLMIFGRQGPRIWGRTAFDFVRSGLFRRPYRQRIFSPPPLGVEIFSRLQRKREVQAPST